MTTKKEREGRRAGGGVGNVGWLGGGVGGGRVGVFRRMREWGRRIKCMNSVYTFLTYCLYHC